MKKSAGSLRTQGAGDQPRPPGPGLTRGGTGMFTRHSTAVPARRWLALLTVLLLLAAACGNSGDDKADASHDTKGPAAEATAGGDKDKFVSLSGVPGVTDKEIAYTVIGTRTNNPLGTCILDCYRDGINAYFAFRNSEGGIYGRKLVVGAELDDELTQNQVRALEVTAGDDAFGVFNATLIANGWADLDQAGIPTYTWGIHANEAANRQNIFSSIAISCAECTGRGVPYAAKLVGAKKVASLGYGVSENSKICATTVGKSLEMYESETGASAVYVNDELDYGLPNGIGPEVTAMKKAGVDFISTCLDLNGMKTLAQELDRQGMQDVTLYHPNTYNQGFVKEAGKIFEGDIVSVAFRPFEADAGDSALADYLKWMEETGSELTEHAMVGWINAELAYQGLLAAGPEFDRAKVLAATNAMKSFSAGGLITPIDWTRQHIPPTQDDRSNGYTKECVVWLRVVNGAFEPVAPKDKPWLCWPNDTTDWSEPVPTSFK
jgi:hypothetical protein